MGRVNNISTSENGPRRSFLSTLDKSGYWGDAVVRANPSPPVYLPGNACSATAALPSALFGDGFSPFAESSED